MLLLELLLELLALALGVLAAVCFATTAFWALASLVERALRALDSSLTVLLGWVPPTTPWPVVTLGLGLVLALLTGGLVGGLRLLGVGP